MQIRRAFRKMSDERRKRAGACGLRGRVESGKDPQVEEIYSHLEDRCALMKTAIAITFLHQKDVAFFVFSIRAVKRRKILVVFISCNLRHHA